MWNSSLTMWSNVDKPGQKPAWNFGMQLKCSKCHWSRNFITRSKTLATHDVREIGRYELTSLGGLPGLRRGTTIAVFQWFGLKPDTKNRLNKCKRDLRLTGLSCLSISLWIRSGPNALLFRFWKPDDSSDKVILLLRGFGTSEEIAASALLVKNFSLSAAPVQEGGVEVWADNVCKNSSTFSWVEIKGAPEESTTG